MIYSTLLFAFSVQLYFHFALFDSVRNTSLSDSSYGSFHLTIVLQIRIYLTLRDFSGLILRCRSS